MGFAALILPPLTSDFTVRRRLGFSLVAEQPDEPLTPRPVFLSALASCV